MLKLVTPKRNWLLVISTKYLFLVHLFSSTCPQNFHNKLLLDISSFLLRFTILRWFKSIAQKISGGGYGNSPFSINLFVCFYVIKSFCIWNTGCATNTFNRTQQAIKFQMIQIVLIFFADQFCSTTIYNCTRQVVQTSKCGIINEI